MWIIFCLIFNKDQGSLHESMDALFIGRKKNCRKEHQKSSLWNYSVWRWQNSWAICQTISTRYWKGGKRGMFHNPHPLFVWIDLQVYNLKVSKVNKTVTGICEWVNRIIVCKTLSKSCVSYIAVHLLWSKLRLWG